ncbi:uncharacterized protein [Asterias amurensis]|uniref:uncharacterized protein n=1 Tax=Asterias amurensis TaxID=7602 RepID=UPI003AB9193C
MATNFVDTSDFTGRALLVEGIGRVHSQMQTADKITIHFQKKVNKGGDVTKVLYPLDSNRDAAIVVFEDAKQRESALLHQHVFHEVSLRVQSLPPIFRSVEVEIDPVYVKLLPNIVHILMRSRGSSRTSCFDRHNSHKLSFSSPSELRYVEEEVYKGIARQSEAAHFSTLASGYSDPTLFEQESINHEEEFGLGNERYRHTETEQERIRYEEEFGHGKERNRYKETESGDDDPEDFPSQQTTERDNSGAHASGDKRFLGNESTTDVQPRRPQDQTSRYDDQTGFSTEEKNSIVLDMLSYNFIRKFEMDAVDQILKKYNVRINEKNDGLMMTASFAARGKTSAEEIQKAIDEFTTLHQTTYGKLSRKIVECPPSISTAELESAASKTSKVFKSKTLITKIDSNPVQYVILSSSDAGDVAQHFRKEACIPSKKKLRTAKLTPGPESKENVPEQATEGSAATNQSMTSYGQNKTDSLSGSSALHSSQTPDDTFVTNEGMAIYICKGDITKQPEVHAIVNPTDGTLNNCGGASKAIGTAAGPQLKGWCDQFMKKRHGLCLQDSEWCVSPGYGLNCGLIIHIGPMIIPKINKQQQMKVMDQTFVKCLVAAHTNYVKSLAMPLLGSGSAGAPKEACADALVHALITFSRNEPRRVLNEVYLVNIDSAANKALKHSLESAFKETRSTISGDQHSSTASVHNSRSAEMSLVGKSTVDFKDRPTDYSGKMPTGRNVSNTQPSADQDQGTKSTTEKGQSDTKTDFGAGPTSERKDATNAASKECPICLSDIIDEKALKCSHRFCRLCIDESLKQSHLCPLCRAVSAQPKGIQPDGTMTTTTSQYHLPGYPHNGTITIFYNILSGIQSECHPHPGKHFTGVTRIAYLPDSREGRKVLSLLQKAFDARLVFTVGRSITSGSDDVVTWNDIHHKTSHTGGPSNYGYPDPGYLQRVKEDLAALGIS